MLDRFDWLRRSRTGAELLATLRYLQNHPKLSTDNGELGPPFSALNGPCLRCWVYPRTSRSNARHCSTCQAILSEAWRLGTLSRDAVVIWGFVNQLPRQLHSDAADAHSLGAYVHDERHFLMMLYYRDLQSWFQELIIYHEARFPQDKLRVRFYAATYQVLDPRTYDREGVLTFEVSEFLRMLDLAVVFRSVLLPDEQKILRKLLSAGDTRETQFYWGRFVGTLSQEAKDMLNAWKIRQWSGPQVDLLYELVEYVGFSQFR
jgi:hypothetical protein